MLDVPGFESGHGQEILSSPKRPHHPGSYHAADKSLTRPTSRCILFDGENISFDASLVIYIYIYVYI